MARYAQTSFIGGMNMAVDDARLADDEYRLGINVRNRFGDLRPVRRPENITAGLTAGVPIQAVYALGDFILVVQDGNAYYKHRFSTAWTTLWNASTNATMRLDPSAQHVFIQSVPGSTLDIARKAREAADGTGTGTTNSLKLDYDVAQFAKTVAGVVFQDGVNQPNLLVFSSTEEGATATVRKCRTFAEWGTTIDGVVCREYVPIGKQMVYFHGKLYIVSADGSKIYQSVTGRPIDFMIPVDEAGAKIGSDEATAGAEVMAYPVSYEKITCIAPLNTTSLFVGTRTGCYAITPTYDVNLFGEPTYRKQYLFGASVVNQFSFVDVLGDFAFIDSEGLRSFNAVKQLRNEGRNSAFSLKIAKVFEDIVQLNGAVISFDNYTFFAVKTIYGYGVLVYDGTLQKFVSLDMYQDDTGTPIGEIIQFSKIDTNTTHEVYAATSNGKLLRLFTGAKYNDSFVQTKGFNTGTVDVEQKPLQLRTLFNNIERWEFDTIRLDTPHDVSPEGVNTAHTDPGTSMKGVFALPVTATPFDMAVGTVIHFTGGGAAPHDAGATFTLSDNAGEPAGSTSLTGIFESTGEINQSYTKGFVRFTGEGTVKSSLISNSRKSETPGTISKTIVAPLATAIGFNEKYPIMWNNENKIQQILFNFQQGRSGLKLGYTIEWNNSASLSMISAETIDQTPKNPLMTQAYG
jgi:hypothetical protein